MKFCLFTHCVGLLPTTKVSPASDARTRSKNTLQPNHPMPLSSRFLRVLFCLLTFPGVLGWSATVNAQVVAWGDNVAEQTTVPTDLGGVLAIAGGNYHSLALKADGSVAAWGDNPLGQITVPVGLSGVVAIAAGGNHSLALKADGFMVVWGDNSSGQRTVPAGLSGVVAIAGGGTHSLALKADGSVVAWGSNAYGQAAVPVGLSGVVAIAAGGTHSLALKADGSVVAWGNNNYGQTAVPAGLSGVVAIAGGGTHSLALRANGSVTAWGNNDSGQGTVPVGISSGGSGVVDIAAGGSHSLALKADGSMVAWGSNASGQRTVPAGLSGVVAIAAGSLHTLALKAPTGLPLITCASRWITEAAGARPGNVLFYQRICASGSPISYAATGLPTGLVLNSATGIITGAATEIGTFPLTLSATNSSGTASADVVLTVTGVPRLLQSLPGPLLQNGRGQIFAVGNIVIAGLPLGAVLDNSTGVITGLPPGNFNLNVTISNPYGGTVPIPWAIEVPAIFAWGNNSSAVPAGLSSGVVAIAAQGRHSLALKADGSVVAWGDNDSGQSTVPVGLSGIVAIAAGSAHSLALKADGSVVAWGLTSRTAVPAGLSGVVAISGGVYHSLASKADGSVVAWGEANAYGELSVPAELSGVVAISSGYVHLLALKADGYVAEWGRPESALPPGLRRVVAIAGGGYHSLALKIDGTAVAWGSNSYGQSTVPAGLSGVVAIAGGEYHSLALKGDGSVVAWGYNNYGQSTVPAGLSGVAAIAAGSRHSLALLRKTPTASSTVNSFIGSTHSIPAPEPTMAVPQYTATNLPPGLSINASTGTIAGTFTQVGVWQTVVRSFNIVASSTQTLTFSIEPPVSADFTAWSTAYWPAEGQASPSEADADGDGVSNLMEYALRTNPTLGSRPAAAALSRADGAFVMEMDVGDRGVLLTWQGEFSSDLNFTAPTIVTPTVVPGAASGFIRLRFVDPAGVTGGSRFSRMRVTLP
jgi:alpha-tubulin suppressor-like RCC1 family protein